MEELAIKIEHVSKEYRLGAIGGGTLTADLQSWWARKRGREDPNSLIGARTDIKIGDKFLALDDINLEVRKGEALGIIGHNGAGKSTLLKLLSRVTAPTVGTISYNGRITSMLEVGTGFHRELNGRENVYMNGAILGMTKKEIDEKMEQIIDFSEVREFIDTPVKRYSSGMYVKLAFSVAAHLDSEIMIMDEVLAVGDMAFQKKCLTKMREVAKKQGRTVLYVSHNMNTIRQLCDRCVVLNKGKIIFDGDVEKGIDLYLSEKTLEKKKHYQLDKQQHDTYTSNGVLMKELDFVETEIDVSKKQALQFALTFDSLESCSSLRFRIVVTTAEGLPVATAHTAPMDVKKAENNIIGVSVDLNCIAPGDYTLRIIAFEDAALGRQTRLDDVPCAGSFSIKENYSVSGMTWSHRFWGHTELPPAVITDPVK